MGLHGEHHPQDVLGELAAEKLCKFGATVEFWYARDVDDYTPNDHVLLMLTNEMRSPFGCQVAVFGRALVYCDWKRQHHRTCANSSSQS